MAIPTCNRTLVIKKEKIMKKKIFAFLLPLVLLTAGGCIENEERLFKQSIAEFDATVWNTPLVGRNYPMLTRVAGFGRAVSTTLDPLISRTSGTFNVRVNLVSAQFTTDQVLNVSVVAAETTAVQGTHFNLPTTVTIPANTSFGLLPVTVVNPGPGVGTVDLVLQIDGNDTVKPSENFKKLGVRIPLN